MDTEIDVSAIIDSLGGTSKAAKFFEVKPPSISEWKARNHIPHARLMYLRLARPDVVPDQTSPVAQTEEAAA